MSELWVIAIWAGACTLYLIDSLIITTVMGVFTRPAVRQEWLAAPLLFTFVTLLFTPWALWTGAVLLAALALHLAAHLAGMRRIAAGLLPAPPALAERVVGLARRWSTPMPTAILIDPTDRLEPGVMGLRRQSLLLPQMALSLPPGELEAVIAHELAHVAARDPLKLWLTGFARTMLAWHPIARQLARGLLLEVELEADWRAAAWLGDADAYALTLGRWTLRRAEAGPSRFGVALTGTSSQLMLRLKSLLDPEAPPAHLELPRWVPGGERARRSREERQKPRRPRTERAVRLVHLGYTVGYLISILILIRLV